MRGEYTQFDFIMETTDEFIARRKAEIDAEMERLRIERRQIVAAELVAAHEKASRADRRREQIPETIKEQVVKILNDCPKGLNAKEIQAELSKRYSRNVKRESLSPQLSRLGAGGVIKRQGKTWILPLMEKALASYKESFEAKNSVSELAEVVSNGNAAPAKENPQEFHS